MSLRTAILRSWHKPNLLTVLLWPLSLLYRLLFAVRARLYAVGWLKRYRAAVPVIVVGNLTVGGTGKTPLVIYLIEQLRERGFSPGVISRGYQPSATAQSNSLSQPVQVTAGSKVEEVGDEPLLIVKRTGVPMVVGANRGQSIEVLLSLHSVDVVISDDGLQHLPLERDIEVCLVDATSNHTNYCLLPAGPYREPVSRLNTVDFVVRHGGDDSELSMTLVAQSPRPVLSESNYEFRENEPLHALAGIGNPQRFFDTCKKLGFQFDAHVFPDHHAFSASDINFADQRQVLMTEKDAVKCKDFATQQHWFLPVDAKLSGQLIDRIEAQLKQLIGL